VLIAMPLSGNHTAYGQVKGTKTPADQIAALYDGLRQSHLNDFDVMLSGYIPSAEAVEEVGKIGRELRYSSTMKPGSFFWVFDPVMGDNGRLYVAEEIVPAYKSLLREADLILPNQFEAETLSGVKITDLSSLVKAIEALHHIYQIPHILITSLRLSTSNATLPTNSLTTDDVLTVIGSTRRADHSPRLFRIDIPAYPIFFSGTGDMLAALTVARLREAVFAAGLQKTAHWLSPDDVEPAELPLAKATEKVLASMQAVLAKTAAAMEVELKASEDADEKALGTRSTEENGAADEAKRKHLMKTKAAEVRVVRNVEDLRNPPDIEGFRAKPLEF